MPETSTPSWGVIRYVDDGKGPGHEVSAYTSQPLQTREQAVALAEVWTRKYPDMTVNFYSLGNAPDLGSLLLQRG